MKYPVEGRPNQQNIQGLPKSKYKPYMKKHGCERPFNPLQILSWIVFVICFIAYFVLYLPPLPNNTKRHWVQVICTVLFLISCIIVAIFDVISALSVPTDPIVLKERELLKKGAKLQMNTELNSENQLMFCYICKTHCLEESKHCSQCDRCVYKFDHHCQWLNNCVGKNNYKWFFSLITSTTFMVLIHLIVAIQSLALKIKDDSQYEMNIVEFYGITNSNPHSINKIKNSIYALTWVTAIIEIPFLFGIGQLLIFHIFLLKNNKTTYEYITQKQEKDKENEGQKMKQKKSKLLNQPIQNKEKPFELRNNANLLNVPEVKKSHEKGIGGTTLITKATNLNWQISDIENNIGNEKIQIQKRSCYQKFKKNYICCFFCCDLQKMKKSQKQLQYQKSQDNLDSEDSSQRGLKIGDVSYIVQGQTINRSQTKTFTNIQELLSPSNAENMTSAQAPNLEKRKTNKKKKQKKKPQSQIELEYKDRQIRQDGYNINVINESNLNFQNLIQDPCNLSINTQNYNDLSNSEHKDQTEDQIQEIQQIQQQEGIINEIECESLEQKFEEIMSGNGAIFLQTNQQLDQNPFDQSPIIVKENEIIEEVQEVFVQTNNNNKFGKTRNIKVQQPIVRFTKDASYKDESLIKAQKEYAKVHRIHNFSLDNEQIQEEKPVEQNEQEFGEQLTQ